MSASTLVSRPAFRIFALMLAGGLCALASHAQQPKLLAPHKPVAPRLLTPVGPPPIPKLQTSVGGFWMTNAYFKSALYLKNGLKTGPLTVTPALYLSNGVRLPLAPVTMEPSGTAVVDINLALADRGFAYNATLNGYVEITFQWAWNAICASVRNVDTVHSLIFGSNLQPLATLNNPDQTAVSSPSAQDLEGLWWKEESNVMGFVALSNVSGSPVDAAIQVLDDQDNNLGNHSVTVSPHGTKVVDLTELLSAPAPRGGLTLSYNGPSGSLLVFGALEDESVGYSAHMPIGPLPKASNPVTTNSFAELGLMTATPDPMMNFPRGTLFTPYSVVRNSSNLPLTVSPTLWWMQGGSVRSSLLPPFAVPPHRTQILDISSYLTAAGLKNYNGDVNLVLDTKGQSGGLLAAAGSVDQTKTYVFEVLPRSFTESVSKSIAYWSTANRDDTMITLWNPADEQQDLVFTLYYSGGHNSFPIYLGPRESRSLNVSEFTMEGIHDIDGNMVPMEAQTGSAEISGAQGENEHILIGVEAAVYNVVKATCEIVCETCIGFVNVTLVQSPFSLTVGNSIQQTFAVTYSTGTQYNRTNLGIWSSTNTSVASVNYGLISGVGAGSATVSVIDTIEEPVYVASLCTEPPLPACPFAYTKPTDSSPGTIFGISNVIPYSYVIGTTGTMTIYGAGFSGKGTPIVQFTGTGISVVNPTVESDTVIQAGYAVSCSASPPNLDVTVSFSSFDGGLGTNPWPISLALPAAPTPTIQMAGQNISGTQSVVVGQQIALTASVSLPACMTFSSQSWSVPPGTAVGGYVNLAGTGPPDSTGGQVESLPSDSTTDALPLGYTFYWVYSGSSFNMSYAYTMSGGFGSVNSAIAKATFNVTGGGGLMSSAASTVLTIENLPTCGQTTPYPSMVYGNITGCLAIAGPGSTFGVVFTAPATLSGGSFSYAQLLNTDTSTQPGAPSCVTSEGIDGTYPYGGTAQNSSPLQAADAPGIQLLSSSASTVQRSFNATMFLMWTSNLSNSIPIPIGYQTWAFAGTASCSASCGTWNNWTATPNGTPGLVGNFVPSSASQTTDGYTPLQFGYPTWTGQKIRTCH